MEDCLWAKEAGSCYTVKVGWSPEAQLQIGGSRPTHSATGLFVTLATVTLSRKMAVLSLGLSFGPRLHFRTWLGRTGLTYPLSGQ